jgi:hypothetical protein
VLPNSIWKGADAKSEQVTRIKVQRVDHKPGSVRAAVNLRTAAR